MNDRPTHRRPATFKLDDPHVVVMSPDDDSRAVRGTVQVVPEPEPAALPVPRDDGLLAPPRGFRWGTLFWSSLGGLVLLGAGLGLTNLVEDLFNRVSIGTRVVVLPKSGTTRAEAQQSVPPLSPAPQRQAVNLATSGLY